MMTEQMELFDAIEYKKKYSCPKTTRRHLNEFLSDADHDEVVWLLESFPAFQKAVKEMIEDHPDSNHYLQSISVSITTATGDYVIDSGDEARADLHAALTPVLEKHGNQVWFGPLCISNRVFSGHPEVIAFDGDTCWEGLCENGHYYD